MISNSASVKVIYGQKHEITSQINLKLINYKKVYGKVFVYDEQSILKMMPDKQIDLAIDQMDQLIRSDVTHFLRVERILHSNKHITTFFHDIFDILYHPNIKLYVSSNTKSNNLTLSEAYKLAHKINLNAKFKEYQQKNQEVDKKKLQDFVLKINQLVEKHVYRIVFDFATKDITSDFILVTKKLYPSLFHESHSNLVGIVIEPKTGEKWHQSYAVHYQIPIVISEKVYQQNDDMLIDLIDQSITVYSDSKTIEENISHEELIGRASETFDIIAESDIHLYGMFAHYKDVTYSLNPVFSNGIVYLTDFAIFAKGISLTVKEWEKRFHHIFKTYSGQTIIIRMPIMHKDMRTPEFDDVSSLDMLYCNPSYFESIVYAAAKIHQKFPEKDLSFMIANIESRYDFENWAFLINEMYREVEKNLSISFISSFDTRLGLFEQPSMLSIKKQSIHFDYACEEYFDPFNFGISHLDIKKVRDSYLYADLTYNKEKIVSSRSGCTNMIMGHYLTPQDIFHRILVGGFRHVIVPMQLPHAMIDEILLRMSTRGKFKGVNRKDRLKTIIYRLVKEKYNLSKENSRRSKKIRQLFEEFIRNEDYDIELDEKDKEDIIKLLEKDEDEDKNKKQ